MRTLEGRSRGEVPPRAVLASKGREGREVGLTTGAAEPGSEGQLQLVPAMGTTLPEEGFWPLMPSGRFGNPNKTNQNRRQQASRMKTTGT